MKRPIIIILCLGSVLILSGCSGEQEAKRRELIQDQLGIIKEQVDAIDRGQTRLQQDLNQMKILLDTTGVELDEKEARLYAVNAMIPYLRDLTTVGFGESPGKWIVRNPATGVNVLLLLAFSTLMLWLFWRIRQRRFESDVSAEIDSVVRRLSNEADRMAPGREKTGAPPTAAQKPVPDTPEPPRKHTPVEVAEEAKPEKKTREPVESQRKEAPGKEKKAGKAEERHEAAGKPARITAAKKKGGRRKTAGKKSVKKSAREKSSLRAPAKKCKVPGCHNKHRSKGYCNKHYQQWRKGTLKEG